MNETYSDIVGKSVGFFHEDAGATADYVVGSDQTFGPLRSLVDPGSISIFDGFPFPDAYRNRYEFAIFRNTLFTTTNRRMRVSTSGTGGANRTTGLSVEGVGDAGRGEVERIFFRAITDLMPSATSLPLAADAISAGATDLAGGSEAQRAIAQALAAAGLQPKMSLRDPPTDDRARAGHAGVEPGSRGHGPRELAAGVEGREQVAFRKRWNEAVDSGPLRSRSVRGQAG